MKLYGSTTSPYVRRIRLFLSGKDYEFINMDIFAGPGRELLRAKNPALKVPMLEDGELIIYDSRVVFRYLSEKFAQAPLSWPEENRLTLIDAANDTFVQLMMLKRSDIANQPDKLFFKLNNERIDTLLTTLSVEVEAGHFAQWDYPAICLFCLLDWVAFRELASFDAYPALQAFWQQQHTQADIASTDPRV
ncbi:MAG TPA: glutathione S-transferase [Alteromonas sp.]|jgi:glutathione S-transferase|nr:glutathione S-transferase [Alteromonas sp.]HCB09106.1 glutathione S-transferase [Alteromonas sp.]HCL11074.1 glutathione S-transferase [Alteromonas sp.]HCV19747.1 glutathione S-transferase [Alteromonas sp.]|tara:strand:- start:107 stop:679 length:573 start_codon:yes stop_codon:yes gene_type:complete